MSCNCTNNTTGVPATCVYYGAPCVTSTSSSGTYDSSTVIYTGSNLVAIGVSTNTSIETILGEINTAVGAISGIDWSSFDYGCVQTTPPIEDAQDFAEAISAYACALNDTVDTFINTTYAGDLADLQADISSIDTPNITSCSFVGITPSDNIVGAVTKLANASCTIYETINPENADWEQCFTVSSVPTNITDGFDVILDRICDIYNILDGVSALPTFDNTNSCLSTPVTSTDSLYDTVVKIRDYSCGLPTFDIDNLAWTTCIGNPNPSGGADLESAMQAIIDYLNAAYSKRVVSWDTDYFDVAYSNPSNTCSGYTVSLQSGLGFEDKLVALDASDASPNYLLTKMLAGTNTSFDTVTTPGSVIINCDAEDVYVKANSGDASAGYLIDKVEGQSDPTSAISITESYNSTSDKVDLTPTVNYGNLVSQILSYISTNGDAYSTLQTIICSMQPCPDGTDRTISAVIEVASGSASVEYNLSFDQATPLLDMYTSGDVTASAGDTFNTGAYSVTSSTTSVTGTLTLVNNDSGNALPYYIYVTDSEGTPITGSTSQLGSIPASDTLTIDPFVYGSASDLVVHVEIGTGITTSTTTTTTTTAP